ncbi:uncharacterized protein HRG_10370 [Hirsutella rhossiliensis]|uniref:Uncharacterized protein n=1 Tax=Hirsutella rhossiliensis TaxID=111463 RepID=A0A9P8SDF3_9HYPO|nr:uncharacterized protein HRG_10370 [Hirsutella rhossiliensis]KAH0958683.1 hypothetical protein HRG_10370 [Hirsutella rhossiliensis]
MAEAGNDQALATTFAFGTVAIAAVAAASLHLRGGASSLFRDALRLVLVGYLTTSFLWALIGFIATFVQMSAVPGCQAAVAFAAIFDQLARILLEEFLFWAMKCEIQASVRVLLPQGIFLLRFILGGIFVGFQRPQYKPVCVGTTIVTPIAVVLLVTEAAIVVMLLIRASSVGIFRDMQEKTPAWPRSRSLLFITLALGLWIALSIPMILGMESFDLVVRTVLPAIGSLVAIVLVAVFRNTLKSSLINTSQRPQMTEGPASDLPPANGGSVTRNLPNRDASPSYTSNPFTAPPRDAPSSSDSERPFASRDGTTGLPIISRPSPGQADAGVGGVPVTGQLFPPIKAQAAPAAAKSFNERPTKKAVLKGGKVTISYPVPNDDEPEPLGRVPTVDLATAAKDQKERRDNTFPQPSSSDLVGSPKALSPREIRNQPQNLKRKEVGMSIDSMVDDARQSPQQTEEPLAKAETSSAQISPAADNVRRRSPIRQAPQVPVPSFPADIRPSRQRPASPPREEQPEIAKTPVQLRQMNGIPNNPRARIQKPAPKDQVAPQETVELSKGPKKEDSSAMRGVQDSSPAAPKDERGLKQISPSVSDMSAAALPPLPAQGADLTKPSRPKEASATTHTPEAPARDPRPHHSTGKFLSKFSLDTTFSAFDEQQNGVFEPSQAASQSHRSPQGGERNKKRLSSPVIPADDRQGSLASQNWDANEGSRRVHFPEPVTKPQAVQVASSTATPESRMWLEPNDRRHMVESALLTDDDDEGKETMTVMLDVPVEQAKPHKQDLAGSVPDRGSWHRRVGDKCPTFSDRKRMTRTRLVPRPPPLPLDKPTKTRKAATAELPPLETPKQALEKIQEQLNRLGELVEPPATEEGQQQPEPEQPQENLRRGTSLLADLEMEMGMQEDHWQEMRRDYSRVSMSTLASSPNTEPPSAKLERMLSAAAGADSAGLEAPIGLDVSTLNLGNLSKPFSSPSDLEKWALGGDKNLGSIQAPQIDSARPPVSTSLTSSPGIRHVTSSDFSERSTDAAIQSLELTPSPSRGDLQRPVTRKASELLGIESPMLHSTSSTPKETHPAERPRTMRPPRRSKRMSSLPDILEDPVPMVGKRGTLGLFQFPWGEKSDSASVPLSSQMQAAMNMSMGMGMPVNMAPDYPSSFFDDYDDDEAAGDEYGVSSEDDEYGEDDDEDEDDDDDSFDEATLWEIANLLKSDKVPSRGSLFPEQERGGRQEPSSGPSRHHASVSAIESRDSEPPVGSSRVPSNGRSSSRNQSMQTHLWGGKSSHASTMRSIGLPQPDKTWETYLTCPAGTVRAPIRVLRPATLTSNTLWPADSGEPMSTPTQPAMGLWQSTVIMSSSRVAGPVDAVDLKQQETVTEILPFFLDATLRWSQPKFPEPASDDLAQPDQAMGELHHAPENAPVHVTPQEASQALVESELLQAPGPSYAVGAGGGAVTETGSGETVALWVPPVAAKAEESRGLFQMRHVCDKKGEMSTEPAALEMRPNPRTRPQTLEKLESTGLWSLPPKHSFAHDWISLSSMRPRTPEAMSSAWSSRSPFTDASSTHSSITRLSTASGSLFTGYLEETASCSSSQSPASQAEWAAALAEALAASSSGSVVSVSAPSEEVAAASESVSPGGGFDTSTMHPVFLTSDFDTSVGDIHPAALGY